MKLSENLQNGNNRTQVKLFLIGFAVIVLALAAMAYFHVINFSDYNY